MPIANKDNNCARNYQYQNYESAKDYPVRLF